MRDFRTLYRQGGLFLDMVAKTDCLLINISLDQPSQSVLVPKLPDRDFQV